ncbi:IS3 family transposase [Streptomyces fildesensis]|uniref:IS3 family transposase n=1 Tax=Streptomyces fildesensis TaxID=375757 RepID=UPI0018DF625F|nr:IS3 family transposase [Streptomyces fildesensis]
MKVAYIDHHKNQFGVQPICDVLAETDAPIAPSTYYAALGRPPSARSRRDEHLTEEIRRIHTDNYAVYGARKVHAVLVREGFAVARCTVERLMRRAGLRGVIRAKSPRTTRPAPETSRPADLVERQFTATAPNQLWVADITYIRTFSGWVYAAFVIDVFSRMVVGWQVATNLYTELALDALEMGIWRRRHTGADLAGLIHHSDRGVQGGFNRSSQHLDHGGMRWDGTRSRRRRRRLRERDGSGQRIGRCDLRCVRRVGRSRLVQCSATSGSGSRRE